MSEAKSEAKASLMNSVEDSFTNALGPKEKCLCCKQKDAVITMCVLLVLSILYHFGVNVGMRWGKPCFHWWEHWATTVTFAIGAIARLAVLPLAVLALVDTKKPVAETKYLRALFHALLAVAVIQILDVGLCIFEVNSVCESDSMKTFDECATEYSKYAPDTPTDLARNNTDGTFSCPRACIKDGYDWTELVCTERFREKFRAPDPDFQFFCEWTSTLYDIVLGLISVAITVAFAWSINSYRLTAEDKTSG